MRDAQAIWQPSGNYWTGRAGHKPQWVIIHGTAGGGAVSWLTNPQSQASTHYVIEEDGSIYCLVDETDSAWGNGILEAGHDPWWSDSINPNYQTISIEHQKQDTTNMIPITAAQQKSSFALVERICKRWGIPARKADSKGGIAGHYSLQPTNRAHCPGTYPWDELFTYLEGGIMKPTGWIDKTVNGEQRLYNPANSPHPEFYARTGYRDWILSHAWEANDLLLGLEEAANPVELGVDLGAGTRQFTMYHELGWTSAKGVYIVSVGREANIAIHTPAPVVPPAPVTPIEPSAADLAIAALKKALAT